MKLIVNADDLGYSEGINRGIAHCFEQGVVRSATLMANMSGCTHALALIQKHPLMRAGTGVHLNITRGEPLTKAPSLVDDEGLMYKRNDWHNACEEEIEAECTAQIERVIEAGITPTHLDSHHHVHAMPRLADIMRRLSSRYGLPVRPYACWHRHDIYLSTAFSGHAVTEDLLIGEIKNGLDSGRRFMELMCHPGYPEPELKSEHVLREAEAGILCSERVARFIARNEIELCSYAAYSD
ncbi:MAG: ChbG/HpnK family deacetylase [Christensenellales bacterium]|jgi:predicted glycoside hydrolase/deacetylase ChbG (UPF0249 family)